ncbi:MAG: hypothetical protein E7631_04725 [Ruminococcaceae bacterium]|nr:hypothetical protein [Oscillospiraceae bacterium]
MNALITLENFALQPMDDKILALNTVSREHGLLLTPEDARELSEIRERSLKDNERIEIGLGAMEGIIRRFSRSSFINQENYAYVIAEVTDLFYYIKTETDDKVSDTELLDELYLRFEQRCRGSVDLLVSREGEILIRKINAGENYEKWFGETDNADTSRDTDVNARRDDSGVVVPYLTDEDRNIVKELENTWKDEMEEDDD